MLEKQTVQKFKKKLEKEKKDIEAELKKHGQSPDFGNDIDSFEEETDESAEIGHQLSIAQTYKNRLADIDSALGKIQKGKYGICEKCGKEISLKVLEASPESRLCQVDKQKEKIKSFFKKIF